MHIEFIKKTVKDLQSMELEKREKEWEYELISINPFHIRWVQVNKLIIPVPHDPEYNILFHGGFWVDFFGIVQIAIHDIVSLEIDTQAISEDQYPIEETLRY